MITDAVVFCTITVFALRSLQHSATATRQNQCLQNGETCSSNAVVICRLIISAARRVIKSARSSKTPRIPTRD